jgi:hypothetical protein
MEGNGVEVEVEGLPAWEAQSTDGIEPDRHELGIAGRLDATTVLGEKGSFGDDVETCK